MLAERWTPIILRNLLLRSTTFSEIAVGAPGLSRNCSPRGSASWNGPAWSDDPEPERARLPLHLTEAGRDLADVMKALGTWGERWMGWPPSTWTRGRPALVGQLVPGRERLPEAPGHGQVPVPRPAPEGLRLWIIFDGDRSEVCRRDPRLRGGAVRRGRAGRPRRMAPGPDQWADALRTDRIRVLGPAPLPGPSTWNLRSPAAHAPRRRLGPPAKGDGMDEPTDPLARRLALSALTTEQFSLQTARMGTIAEANGRSTLYLGTLSSAVIAIAFVGQADELGDAFYLFALLLLPPVFLLGTFNYLRLVQASIEDMVYAVGTFRIRQYFLGLDPAARALLPADRPVGDDQAGAHQRGRHRSASAAAADGGEHGRLHQRDRRRGGRWPGVPRPGGRPGPGGGGGRRAGGGGAGRMASATRCGAPGGGRGPGSSTRSRARACRDGSGAVDPTPADRRSPSRRSSSSRTRAKRRAARAAVG